MRHLRHGGRVDVAIPKVRARRANLPALLDEAKAEYGQINETLTTLDTKAGAIIAYVGVLLVFPDVPWVGRSVGSVLAVFAGGLALWAFSPVRIVGLRAGVLTERHGDSEPDALTTQRLALLLNAIAANRAISDKKAARVKGAAILVLLATVAYAAATVIDHIGR